MAAEQDMAAKGAAVRAVAVAVGHDVVNKLAGAPGLTDAELGGATDNPLNELIAAGNPAQAAQGDVVEQAVAAAVPAIQQAVQLTVQNAVQGLQQQVQLLQQQVQQQVQLLQQQLQQLVSVGVAQGNTLARVHNSRAGRLDRLLPLRAEMAVANAAGAGAPGNLPEAGLFPQMWADMDAWDDAHLDALAAFYQQDFAAGAELLQRKAAFLSYISQF